MAKRPNIKEFKKIAFKDKRFVAEYEALAPEFELVRDFIKARIRARNFYRRTRIITYQPS
jgi:hypothetical protein